MQKITLTISALTLAALADVTPSQAQALYEGAWCAYERGGKGVISRRCDLPTFEACRAWTNGFAGTWCTENPYYRVAEKPPRRKARRTNYY